MKIEYLYRQWAVGNEPDPEEVKGVGAMCLKSMREKEKIKPVETLVTMPLLPGPHIATSFVYSR